jgi:N-acetylglutamate synthase-like GNAT family acetyltransferase
MAYEIRAFKPSDKPQILAIARRTWGGHDHLPHVIDKWAADPNSHLYVIDSRGRVVSVANLRVIERGRTGWMEGLRVHPRYRKRGMGALMTAHLAAAATELGVERLRLVAAVGNAPSIKLAHEIGMSEVLRMSALWRGVSDAGDWKHHSVPIRKVDADTAFDVVEETPGLLLQNVAVYHWYAVDATRESFAEIDQIGDFWVGHQEGQSRSLSIGLAAAEGDERVWSCTTYAREVDAFLCHLSHHLALARKRKIPVLVSIHPTLLDAAYKQVTWLRRAGHRIRLGLFEKVLTSHHDRLQTSRVVQPMSSAAH